VAQQNSRKAYEEFLIRSEAIHRKKASAERGKILPEVPKDADRARFDDLLKRVQQSGDDVSLKRHQA
jgi:hypothetical protein